MGQQLQFVICVVDYVTRISIHSDVTSYAHGVQGNPRTLAVVGVGVVATVVVEVSVGGMYMFADLLAAYV